MICLQFSKKMLKNVFFTFMIKMLFFISLCNTRMRKALKFVYRFFSIIRQLLPTGGLNYRSQSLLQAPLRISASAWSEGNFLPRDQAGKALKTLFKTKEIFFLHFKTLHVHFSATESSLLIRLAPGNVTNKSVRNCLGPVGLARPTSNTAQVNL